MHGVGLAIHKACRPVLSRIPDNFLTIFIGWSITFVYVSLLWVFFRASDFATSVLIIENIFRDFNPAQIPQFFEARTEWCVMMIILIICHFLPQQWADVLQSLFIRMNWVLKLIIFLLTVQLVVEFMSEEVGSVHIFPILIKIIYKKYTKKSRRDRL